MAEPTVAILILAFKRISSFRFLSLGSLESSGKKSGDPAKEITEKPDGEGAALEP